MWHIPRHIVDSNDDDTMIAFVLDQLSDPVGFRKKIGELYGSEEET